MIDRRAWTAAALGSLAWPVRGAADPSVAGAGLLRVPIEAAETGFDPARIGDRYSATVLNHILESPCELDPLAVPPKARPRTAAQMPEPSADYRVWTVRIRPGIFFADDPAFGGKPRELVAEDYVYAIKRFHDPSIPSPGYANHAENKLIGMAALRARKPFDYDRPVEGLRALDRYTLQFRMEEPRPRFINTLCSNIDCGAVAREVVEHYGDDIMAHPVGTGPYRLKSWRRSSRIVLDRNPGYRERYFDADPPADDAQGQAWLTHFKGRRLPFNDGVEVYVLEEEQARWLAFLNGQVDFLRVPGTFANIASPNGSLAPNLARRGIASRRYVNADFTMSFFNMEDPVVGGYTPEKVALRRAIELAYDQDREIRIARRGQAIPGQSPVAPGTFGYDPHLRSENSAYDPARAKGLLDTYGYLDRDGDGWRELPDGRPLVLEMATQASQIERQFDEIWHKSLAAVGLRIRFRTAQWSENMRAARAGKLAMWSLGSTATSPDSQPAFEYMYGPSIGSSNLARFRLPAFDAIYRKMSALPDGLARRGLLLEASKLVTAYMPYRVHSHRIYTDLNHPWLTGYRQVLFRNEYWQYIEVDTALRDRLSG